MRKPETANPWRWPDALGVRDLVTTLLGLGIFCYTGAVLWAPLTDGTMDGVQRAQAIFGMLGPVLGTVFGYYFGTASGERVARAAGRRTAAALEDKAENTAVSDLGLAEAAAELKEAREKMQRWAQLIADVGHREAGAEDARRSEQ